jgi:hypothetical protein
MGEQGKEQEMGTLFIDYKRIGEYKSFRIEPHKKVFTMTDGKEISISLDEIATEYSPDAPNNDIYIFT